MPTSLNKAKQKNKREGKYDGAIIETCEKMFRCLDAIIGYVMVEFRDVIGDGSDNGSDG